MRAASNCRCGRGAAIFSPSSSKDSRSGSTRTSLSGTRPRPSADHALIFPSSSARGALAVSPPAPSSRGGRIRACRAVPSGAVTASAKAGHRRGQVQSSANSQVDGRGARWCGLSLRYAMMSPDHRSDRPGAHDVERSTSAASMGASTTSTQWQQSRLFLASHRSPRAIVREKPDQSSRSARRAFAAAFAIVPASGFGTLTRRDGAPLLGQGEARRRDVKRAASGPRR